MQRAAIIDLGTNTFHILVMEWEGNTYKVLDKLQLPVKLGKGAFEDQLIKPEAYSRGIIAIIEFKALIESYKISIVQAFGTSALRNAKNSDSFLSEAEGILGAPIKVIDGAIEADLIYGGVRRAVPLGEEVCLIMDIGGGSVEFIIADENVIYWKKSFEIGVARLIERFCKTDPIDAESLFDLVAYLDEELQTLWIKAEKYQVKTLIGAAGTFESLASIEMELFHSASQQTQFLHHIIDLSYFELIYERILNSTKKELNELPGLPTFRVEMIAVAVIMIYHVIHRLKIKKIIASDYALKEGVMFKLMAESVSNWATTKEQH